MRIHLLLNLFIPLIFCTTTLQLRGQCVNDNISFINTWEISCTKAMDSLIYISKSDSILQVKYNYTNDCFQKNIYNLRVMALNTILEQTQDQILFDINFNITYLIELNSSGYCNYYGLYIIKKEGESYYFEAMCANRVVKKSKKLKYTFEELNKIIIEFIPHGDYVYGTSCMVTKITNGIFISYPLLYFNSEEINNLKKKLPIKWYKYD